MKLIFGYVGVILLSTLYCQVKAQGATSDSTIVNRLDKYLISANNAYRFNGTAMVIHHGRILLNKGYGISDFKSKSRNEPDTRFPILSITKTFTATIILKLQDEGKLSVKDNLAKYFADYPNGSRITIHHLLTHSSGIHDYTSDVGIEDSLIVNYPISKEKVVSYFRDKPVDFPPGKYFKYCNSGYFLLGLVIEKTVGKPYETVVREMIFQPVGMAQSGFDFIHLPNAMKAQGYEYWSSDKITPYKHYDSTFAYSAGSIYSTTNDLHKWADAIASRKILKRETWKLAFEPKIKNYGYGWQTGEFFGKKYLKHSGGYPGFMSEFIYYPDEELTIILLNNFGTYDQNIWSVGMGLSCISFQLPYDDWKLRHKVSLDKNILQKRVGRYRLNFINQKSDVSFNVKDDQLYISIEGLEVPLYAENESSFFSEHFNAEIIFYNEKITFHSHGRDGDVIKK
jgi:CubicO group peptidase (beta-lactamase class C family)